jgi:integrase
MDLSRADRTLRNLKPRPKSYAVALGNGVSCRVAPSGLRTLELRARLHGVTQRLQLGFYPATTIAEAAAKAAEFRAKLKQGLNPKVEMRRAASADIPRNVAEAAARFIDGHLSIKTRERWAKEATRIIKSDIMPVIGRYPLAQIQRSDLTSLIEAKARALRAKGGKGTMANRVVAVVSKMFGWCAQQGWLSAELARNLPKPAIETAKDRVLSAAPQLNEAGALWNMLARRVRSDTGTIPLVHARVLQLLAITGCRCSEITNLTIAAVNLNSGVVTIANGKTQASNRSLPLTPTMRAIFEAALSEPREQRQQLLFPSPRAGKVIPSNEISRSARDLVKELEHAPWTPHDLRRTAISIMAEAGIDGDIRRRITGHQAPDIHGRVYDRAQRLDDMRAALLLIEVAYATAATAKADNVLTLKDRISK